MNEDQVREIVRDEIAKLIDASGVLPVLAEFVTDSLNGVFGLFGLFGNAA